MNNERKEAFFRILVLIVSGIILNIWKSLIIILSIVNWFIVLMNGKRNKEIAEFCEYWNTQVYEFIQYVSFMSNKRPFPFGTKLRKMNKFR